MIFVDFDDTLCLHTKTVRCANGITNIEKIYDNSFPNKPLIDKLFELKKKGQKLILLTAASSFVLEQKKRGCQENCPGLFDDYVGLAIDCSKKDYMEVLINQNQDKVNIFIDDDKEERKSARDLKNLQTVSPQLFCLNFERK